MRSSNIDLQDKLTNLSPKALLNNLSQEQEDDLYDTQGKALSQQDIEKLTEVLKNEPYLWSADTQFLSSPSDQLLSTFFPIAESLSSLVIGLDNSGYDLARSQGQGHEESIPKERSEREMKNYTVLSQLWYPCSAMITIGEHLDFMQFPVSYRELVYRWIALGRPHLQLSSKSLNTRMSTTQHISGISSPNNIESHQIAVDLQQLCEAQENKIIESIRAYMDTGYTAQPMTFAHFAAYLDVFSAVHAELACLETGLPKNTQNISRFYEDKWWSCLQAFDLDRSICTSRSPHSCLREFLWGEVYNWPLQVIIDQYQIFKNRSSSIKSILIAQFKHDISILLEPPASSSSAPDTSDQDSLAYEGTENMISSPSLPIALSTLGLVNAEASTRFDSLNTSPALDSFVSYWQRDQCSNSTFESPITQTNSTPGTSPLQSDPSHEFPGTTDKRNAYNFAFTGMPTNLPLSMPVSPLMSSRITDHKREATSSLSSCEEQQTNNNLKQYDIGDISSTACSRLLKDASKDISEVKGRESSEVSVQPLLNILSQRRESASSIGSSFKSENALEKVEKYKSLLKDAVAQLDTAARLLNLQTIQSQSPYNSKKHIRQIAATARTLSTMSRTAKRAQLLTAVKLQRPSRPRSYTSS